MNKKILIIFTVFAALLFLILFLITFPKEKSIFNILPKSVSPEILYLTQPITTFTGKVEKVKDNAVVVIKDATQPLPTPVTKTIRYTINVTKETQIIRKPITIPFLFSSPTYAPSEPTFTDIKVGQIITVNFNSDLRLTNNNLTAASINLPLLTNTINGKIIDINNNTLTLKGTVSSSTMFLPDLVSGQIISQKEQEYKVKIINDTEISGYKKPSEPMLAAGNPEMRQNPPVKFNLSDLHQNMRVTVYTAEDVTFSKNPSALRIEPIFQ